MRTRRLFCHQVCSDFTMNIPFSYKGENCTPSNKNFALKYVQRRIGTLETAIENTVQARDWRERGSP